MAGIGFELRKMFREHGLINNVRAYAYSSMTTVGPMILCMVLIAAMQRIMTHFESSYLEWQLFISTVTYGFVFSIIISSGLSMVLTRYISDMIFEKKYPQIISSYYGGLAVGLPFSGLAAALFLSGVEAGLGYKAAAYVFFMALFAIWIQAVYLTALKDYARIVRSFLIGVVIALASGWLLLGYAGWDPVTSALVAADAGFLAIMLLNGVHFEHIFPARSSEDYFSFFSYARKYPSLFFMGTFLYSGVYIHNLVYWTGPDKHVVAGAYYSAPFFDMPVFYAYMSVVPTLVTFVVTVETSFFEKLRLYYRNVLEGGTYRDVERAKRNMQDTLVRQISLVLEIQLLFTVLSIAAGMMLLPAIGFTMAQLDVFMLLALGYFLFIAMFVVLHLLLYFDDRKGVLWISLTFVALNAALTYWTMYSGDDGLGMLLASFAGLCAALARLLHLLRNIDYYTFCAQPLRAANTNAGRSGRRGRKLAAAALLLVTALATAACSAEADTQDASGQSGTPGETAQSIVASTTGIAEDKRIYAQDEDGSVKTLYVTVLPENDAESGLDWYGLNRITDRYSEDSMNIIMQEGAADGSGPKAGDFGYAQTEPNAKISLRGNTARYASQKSYQIKLDDEAGPWLGQTTINLNKHSADPSRLRNKLAFDLFEQIADFTSLRTQFVHLYVKDLSDGKGQAAFEDYGLYTQIEQPNKTFLKSHWLDPYGELYKVAFFEFYRYPEQIKLQSDPAYDKAAFETILEIKGREDHEKLIAMLEDVNDTTIPIDDVMAKHFDLDNFLTWTAVNILTDNMDTDANNYYLYSPLNSDKWYFLPWDYDGAFGLQRSENSIRSYQSGISNYWGSVLHNRYFRTQEHVDQLKAKLEELSRYINRDTIAKQLERYAPIVDPLRAKAPDLNYLPMKLEDVPDDIEMILNTPEQGMKLFLEDLEKPKPFYMDEVVQNGNQLQFAWDVSFDLQGDDLVYDWAVASDPAFTNVIQSKNGLKETGVSISSLKPGTYYWKVVARDSEGHTQTSFDMYEDDDGPYYGILQFEVN